MNHRPSSLSEIKIVEMYPDNWKHDPSYWKDKGIVFEEDAEAAAKLSQLVNDIAHCKIIRS